MSSSIQFLPSIGMTGTYTLKSPFSGLIQVNTQYTCTAIESLSGYIARGNDAYTNIYEANGATETDYESDLEAGAYLVTITSGTGDVVVFPSTSLSTVPDSNGTVYRNQVLALSLSALPDGIDLSSLKTQISDLVLNTLGVSSTIYVASVGSSTVLTTEQSTALEAARAAKMQTHQSPLYRNSVLETQNAALLQKVSELEAYIKKHYVA